MNRDITLRLTRYTASGTHKGVDTMRKVLSILLCCIILTGCTIPALAAESEPQETVRIGYFDSEGYHNMAADGSMSGYGYDFYQMMLRYCNWNYEYEGFEKSWSGIMEMLDSGEVDVVTLANYTPERGEKYLYSDNPVGTASSVITINSDNTDIIAGDYNTYDGRTVGLVKDSAHNAGFEEYAKAHGFTYKAVYYDSATDVLADLRQGINIDMAVTSNMRIMHDEYILDEFNPQPFYAIVRKTDTKLMDEINQGMMQLNTNSPYWQSTLWDKYFGNINENVISLSAEERQYLTELKDSHTVIKAAINPELRPYSYFENGEAKGIAVRIFKEVAAKLGLEYEILESSDRWEYKEQLSSGEADIDLTSYLDFGLAQQYNLKETDAYLTSTMAMLSRKNSNLDPDTMVIAVLRDPTEYIAYNQELIYDHHYVEYNSVQECIDAVKNGDADITYRYVYVAERAAAEDYTNRLQYTIMPNYSFSLAIGVVNQEDYRLLSVLNKGVNSMSDEYVHGIMLDETAHTEQSHSFLKLMYTYPLQIILIIAAFGILVYLSIFLRMRNVNLKKRMQQEKELERFLGYVCKSNEVVMEVNLQEYTANVYVMEDGHVRSKVIPYTQHHYQNPGDTIYPEDYQLLVSHLKEETIDEMIDSEGGEQYFECRCRNAEGNYEWYSYTLQAIPKSPSYPRNFILFKKNINELKQDEEKKKTALKDALAAAKSASQAKGQFLSRMSHEIRTPLNAVIGYMGIAEDSQDNPDKVMHCVHNTKMASEHLLNIINDVLDMSAIENGRMKIAHEEFDLKNQLTTIATIFYNQAKAKNVRFEAIVDGIDDEIVYGDKLRLNQVFMNLLSNAVKFTPEEGHITFEASQKKTDESHVFMTFVVSDTGIGMSEEYKQRLFQPFEQESATTAQKYGGSGLGLSITQNLVKMMGGSIEVDSVQNKGTTFTVSLGFDRSSKALLTAPGDYSMVRALVVDDDQKSAEYIRTVLKRCGAKSDIVTDGQAALKRIKGRIGGDYEYNLCIMDWNMPQMDGIETARKIRSECSSDIPVIIATAYDITEFADAAKELGIAKIVNKPLFQSAVMDILVTTFGKYTPKKASTGTDISLKGMKILFAEDNEMNMEIAVEILQKAGIVVTAVTDGKQACDTFINAPEGAYDAILMDVQMPVMNGYEATVAIRKSSHPQAQTIPIIAMTANAFAEDVNEALANGMNGHIAKPINYDKLFETLNEYKR